MQPIKRSGPPRLSEVRGHTFVWTLRLSGGPSGKWVEAFKNSPEHTIACSPKMMTISPRDRLLVFEIMEDEDTTVSTWIRLIDRWIESANAAVAQRSEK